MGAIRSCVGVLAAIASLSMMGCSSSDDKPNTPANKIGEPCSTTAECSAPAGSYCAKGGMCTRTCTMHSDCGCAAGATNQDIVDGKCKFSCISFTTGDSYCLNTCTSSSDCHGTTTCQATSSGLYKVCS
jgi:hypothetical protein